MGVQQALQSYSHKPLQGYRHKHRCLDAWMHPVPADTISMRGGRSVRIAKGKVAIVTKMVA